MLQVTGMSGMSRKVPISDDNIWYLLEMNKRHYLHTMMRWVKVNDASIGCEEREKTVAARQVGGPKERKVRSSLPSFALLGERGESLCSVQSPYVFTEKDGGSHADSRFVSFS